MLVTEADHPFARYWWPPGHIIGWEHTFVHELDHLLAAIAGDARGRAPTAPTFEDGYRASEVCDAIVRSARDGAPRASGVPELRIARTRCHRARANKPPYWQR